MRAFWLTSARQTSAGRFPICPLRWQQLLQMLMADPPATYAEISDRLGLPVGSIGPTRGRCLEMLRGLLEAP